MPPKFRRRFPNAAKIFRRRDAQTTRKCLIFALTIYSRNLVDRCRHPPRQIAESRPKTPVPTQSHAQTRPSSSRAAARRKKKEDRRKGNMDAGRQTRRSPGHVTVWPIRIDYEIPSRSKAARAVVDCLASGAPANQQRAFFSLDCARPQ
jgi:hypothetical protein